MSSNLQVPIQKYAQPTLITSPVGDNNAPFSFQEWFKLHQGIVPGQEYKQYNSYLTDWYKQKNNSTIDSKTRVKLNYLALLKQLQLFFSKEEAENWYNNIDIENEKELLLAIPYFAKKLKEISIYYLQLREAVKQSKLQYNQNGTNASTIKQLQNIIFSNYTQSTNKIINVPSSIWNYIPQLSSIANTLTIQIEELYDKENYLDKSPTISLSSYFNINNDELYNFLSTKGLHLTSTDWIYKGGIFPLSANYINLSSEDISALINTAATKYLSQNKFVTLQSLTSSIKIDEYTIFIVTGDNYFLWPGTPYNSKAKTLPIYKPTPIQNLNILDLATGGQDLSTSDKIFVKTVKGIEGAWLASQPIVYSTEKMYAVFDANSKTAFRFPYPGYGLSAEGYNWTGVSLTANPQFFYLDNNTKQAVESEYWSTTLDTVSSAPININDTSLVEYKAYPSSNYNLADKILTRDVPPPYVATSYFDETNEAWLYKINQTDISIRANSENIIYWPYQRVEQTENYPQYFPNNTKDICAPLSISSINIPYAIAGSDINSADVIYKVTNYLSTTADATECCWLSGGMLNFNRINAFTNYQNSFQGVYSPGIYIKFLWTGKNNTDVDLVFKSLKHQSDCEYITKNSTYKNPETCSCNQVLFTPFGHPGEKFTDYNSLADYIVEDNSLFSQLDTTVLPTSSFCWFKTNTVQGWGDGRWYTSRANTNNKFYLQTGKIYAYYRTILQDPNIIYPPLIVRYNFDNYSNNYNTTHRWIRAYKDIEGNWINSNEQSKMTLYPGDLLLYNRRGTTSYTLTSLIPLSSYVLENRGSIWSSVDYLTINDGTVDAYNQTFTLNWPSNIYPSNNSNPQYPAINSDYILGDNTEWTVRHIQTNKTFIYKNTPSITIVPTLTGIYQVTVTSISSSSTIQRSLTGRCTFTNIPNITAISPITEVISQTSYPVPMPGFVLNTPLKGWDYNLNSPATTTSYQNIGAKPLWVKTNKNYKNYNYTGVVPRLVDFHNIVYQPEISDMVFNLGQYVEYNRNYPADLNWLQTISLATKKDLKAWCTIKIETPPSNLNNNFSDLVLTPTLSESNLILQNFVNNEPVDVYYNAVSPFIWQITAIPEINQPQYPVLSSSVSIEVKMPWANLTNLQFPTVAVFPTLEQLYSVSDSGGFFTSNNLGASKYVNQDYTLITNSSAISLTAIFEDPKNTVQARGLTNEDQPTPYSTLDNSVWLKEPVTTGPIAGTGSKAVFKKYQKFIPYQSKYETNPYTKLGLVLPTSRQTPWGGKQDANWTDLNNLPVSPTGELNVKKWAESQILKQTNLQLDNWVTDIFGNQYGLYKEFNNVATVDRKNIVGELWTRTNNQFVAPASQSLSGVFDTYKNTSIFRELTGTGIRKVEIFYDTLYIETTGAIIFEKLNYNFDNDTIFSTIDDARFISLAQPVSLNFDKEFANINLTNFKFAKVGDTWFFPELKKVLVNVNSISATLTPQISTLETSLYELDLNTQNLKKVYPTTLDHFNTLNQLTGLKITQIKTGSISYNSLKNELLLSIFAKNYNNEDVILETELLYNTNLDVKTLTVYESVPQNTITLPPFLSGNLYTSLSTTLTSINELNLQLTPVNGPAIFVPVNVPPWVTLTETGNLMGTAPKITQNYNIEFYIQNNIGSTFYNFYINVIS